MLNFYGVETGISLLVLCIISVIFFSPSRKLYPEETILFFLASFVAGIVTMLGLKH